MDSVLRAAAIYLILLVVFKLAGRRTLSDITTFDLVLLLIISEATQQALLGEDYSVTNASLVIVTLVAINILLSVIKEHSVWFAKLVDGVPMIVVENGVPLHHRIRKARLDEDDILEEARMQHGITQLEQIKFAILEKNGGISIIPERKP